MCIILSAPLRLYLVHLHSLLHSLSHAHSHAENPHYFNRGGSSNVVIQIFVSCQPFYHFFSFWNLNSITESSLRRFACEHGQTEPSTCLGGCEYQLPLPSTLHLHQLMSDAFTIYFCIWVSRSARQQGGGLVVSSRVECHKPGFKDLFNFFVYQWLKTNRVYRSINN